MREIAHFGLPSHWIRLALWFQHPMTPCFSTCRRFVVWTLGWRTAPRCGHTHHGTPPPMQRHGHELAAWVSEAQVVTTGWSLTWPLTRSPVHLRPKRNLLLHASCTDFAAIDSAYSACKRGRKPYPQQSLPFPLINHLLRPPSPPDPKPPPPLLPKDEEASPSTRYPVLPYSAPRQHDCVVRGTEQLQASSAPCPSVLVAPLPLLPFRAPPTSPAPNTIRSSSREPVDLLLILFSAMTTFPAAHIA